MHNFQALIYDAHFQLDIQHIFSHEMAQANEYAVQTSSPTATTTTSGDHLQGTKHFKDTPLFCMGQLTRSGDDTQPMHNSSKHIPPFPTSLILDAEINDLLHQQKIDKTMKPKISKIWSESIKFNDTLFYIYTSGTTGLPKAAIIKHSKFILSAIMCRHIMNLTESDVLYTAGLPLYHTLAGMVALSGSICNIGYSFVIRDKFSSNHYWTDCCRYGATASIHIGEVCRYLLAADPCDEEQSHKVPFSNHTAHAPWHRRLPQFHTG